MGGSRKTRTQQADVLKLILLPQPAFLLLSIGTKRPAWASCPDKRGSWMKDSRPLRAKRQESGGGQVGSGIWGRCCGEVWVEHRTTCQVSLRLKEGGWWIGWVRWMRLADKNQTEPLQELRHTHGVLSGAEEEGKQEQRSISSRVVFFSLLSNNSKEPFKMCLFEASQ